MTTPTDKLKELIVASSDGADDQSWHAAVDAVFKELNTPPVNTVIDLETNEEGITIYPIRKEGDNGPVTWALQLPLTTEEEFDALDEESGTPFGYTEWASLELATLSLLIAVRAGTIKFNDGRSVS